MSVRKTVPVRARAFVVVALIGASAVLSAQQSDLAARARALDEQIGRIFQANEYATPRFGPARWLADGASYSTIEQGDIVRYDAATGARSVLVARTRLVPSGVKDPLDVDDYRWSADGRRP